MKANLKASRADKRDLIEWYDKVSTANNLSGVWSIFEVTDFTAVPFANVDCVVYTEHWGDDPVRVDLPKNATWLDIWRAADQAIVESGDDHHVFIERLTPYHGDLLLQTGS